MEYLGLFSTGLILMIVGALLFAARGGDYRSISKHASSSKKVLYSYSVSLAVAVILFAIWVLEYLVSEIGLTRGFQITFALTIAFAALTLLVPDRAKSESTTHKLFAYIMSIFLIALGGMLVSSTLVSFTAQIIGVALLTFMVVVFAYISAVKVSNQLFLKLQVSYFSAFLLLTVVVAYL